MNFIIVTSCTGEKIVKHVNVKLWGVFVQRVFGYRSPVISNYLWFDL